MLLILVVLLFVRQDPLRLHGEFLPADGPDGGKAPFDDDNADELHQDAYRAHRQEHRDGEADLLVVHGDEKEGECRGEIEQERKKPENGFVSLYDNAMRLVREGITTTSEMMRVVSEQD